jgi:hypothetical protein
VGPGPLSELVLQFSAFFFLFRETRVKKEKEKGETALWQSGVSASNHSLGASGAVLCYKKLI